MRSGQTSTVPVMTADGFVPVDFDPPTSLTTDQSHLEPLGPQHNQADHAAWMSSIEHIRSTPGYPDGTWPPRSGMTLEENLSDLRRHADDFTRGAGYTFTSRSLTPSHAGSPPTGPGNGRTAAVAESYRHAHAGNPHGHTAAYPRADMGHTCSGGRAEGDPPYSCGMSRRRNPSYPTTRQVTVSRLSRIMSPALTGSTGGLPIRWNGESARTASAMFSESPR